MVDQGDGKRIIVMTKAGRSLHDRIIELALDREGVLLGCLKPEEVEVLIDLLRRLLAQTPAVNAVQVRKPAKKKP